MSDASKEGSLLPRSDSDAVSLKRTSQASGDTRAMNETFPIWNSWYKIHKVREYDPKLRESLRN